MKILLGNNTLALLAGTETWTLTLARELKKNHEVACYSPLLGSISRQLKKGGIECFNTPQGEYDLIIANHFHIVEALREKYPDTKIVSTIHGIIHEQGKSRTPEYPNDKADQLVAVSEEVQEKLKNDYGLDSVIIRNFFEIEELPINDTPKRILFNSNNNKKDDEVFRVVYEVAKHYQAELLAIGHNFYETPNVKEAVKSSDIVFGIGRSVLEGVALGRLGVVHGQWGTGGVVCEENIEVLRHYNFSGRNNLKKWLTAEELISEIDKHYGNQWQMTYMKNQHNVIYAAEKYLQIYDSLRN